MTLVPRCHAQSGNWHPAYRTPLSSSDKCGPRIEGHRVAQRALQFEEQKEALRAAETTWYLVRSSQKTLILFFEPEFRVVQFRDWERD